MAGLAGLLVQDKFHGLEIRGRWLLTVVILVLIAAIVLVLTSEPVARWRSALTRNRRRALLRDCRSLADDLTGFQADHASHIPTGLQIQTTDRGQPIDAGGQAVFDHHAQGFREYVQRYRIRALDVFDRAVDLGLANPTDRGIVDDPSEARQDAHWPLHISRNIRRVTEIFAAVAAQDENQSRRA
jgi:hypothetical protein